MKEGGIPGLSLVLVQDGQQTIKSYGYADLESKKKVTPATLFQIGSCTKAFTALAVETLVRADSLRLDANVRDYLPWFRVFYQDSLAEVTVRQLLHHTGGIPWNSLSKIPQTDSEQALQQTVRQLAGQALRHLPGSKYEYATINYDVLALIVEVVTRQPFEKFLQERVINTLQLGGTTIGKPGDGALMATGYKISFFKPRVYEAPVFRGNNAAGYVISNAEDMGRWLKFQMGLLDSALYPLAAATHRRDETVPLHNMAAYAAGWEVSLSGNGEIFHGGLNPNYTAYVAFRPVKKLGIVLLANSNSEYTQFMGNKIMKLLAGEKMERGLSPGNGNDKVYSAACFILSVYIAGVAAFLVIAAADVATWKRKYAGISRAKCRRFALSLLLLTPFLFGLYILPEAIAGFTWESITVWMPVSFTAAAALTLAAIATTYLAYLANVCFPEANKYKRIIPSLLLMSILSGLANMVTIVLITSSLGEGNEEKWKYLGFYYLLIISVYLLGRRYVQMNLIRLSRELTYELRMKCIDKIFSTNYQKFEKLDRGRVYTALNDDVSVIGDSTNTLVILITSIFTAAGAFVYLATIAFWAAMLTVLAILSLSTIYYFFIRSTNKYFVEARDTRNVFMRLINGMIDGFKELSLHGNKKRAYQQDMAGSANEYRIKTAKANMRFVDASLSGEIVLILILGAVAFAFPKLFPGISLYTLMSFVILLLYMIGPINTILSSVPAIMNLKIAWHRIQQFIREIPGHTHPAQETAPPKMASTVSSIRAEGVEYRYKNEGERNEFAVGPINLEVRKGEILFIIGGNGSGKTTLAKLLTGLYQPDGGRFVVNDEVVHPSRLGEYFSVVFNPVHLFEKLYDVDTLGRSEEIKKHLALLNLDGKVEITGNAYSTINLSSGQRKRLALLQCYLEDSPIYLFDEWAADQDPEYRQFFYRTLLPYMREMGKIIIAITHDDHYFDVADRTMKMSQGRLEAQPDPYLLVPVPSATGKC